MRCKAIELADVGGQPVQDIYHLRVQGKYEQEYWLHLEMCGSATLEDLDCDVAVATDGASPIRTARNPAAHQTSSIRSSKPVITG